MPRQRTKSSWKAAIDEFVAGYDGSMPSDDEMIKSVTNDLRKVHDEMMAPIRPNIFLVDPTTDQPFFSGKVIDTTPSFQSKVTEIQTIAGPGLLKLRSGKVIGQLDAREDVEGRNEAGPGLRRLRSGKVLGQVDDDGDIRMTGVSTNESHLSCRIPADEVTDREEKE